MIFGMIGSGTHETDLPICRGYLLFGGALPHFNAGDKSVEAVLYLLRKNGDHLLRCDHEHRTAMYWLVKEQIGDRLNPIPKVEN